MPRAYRSIKRRRRQAVFPVTYEWVFVAPQAALYDASNKIVGTHSAGPNWELSLQDSVRTAFRPGQNSGRCRRQQHRLAAADAEVGVKPHRRFRQCAAYIQRIATSGGKRHRYCPPRRRNRGGSLHSDLPLHPKNNSINQKYNP